MDKKIAVLYQATTPPAVGQSKKPMKEGGYKDSGADIAFALSNAKIPIVTPVALPNASEDLDWVFPDSSVGIQSAVAAGVEVLWLNTVLFSGHPIEAWFGKGLEFVGQSPKVVDAVDDKFNTNNKLREHGLNVADATLFSGKLESFEFPLVIKPIRGRGSQGVFVVHSEQELNSIYNALVAKGEYGSEFILERFLEGTEITITVMPPGRFQIGKQHVTKTHCWALPVVERFNHQNGIAPYSGVVAVTDNSRALTTKEMQSEALQRVIMDCEVAADIVRARAPVRIDCRQDSDGVFKIFDLNTKPNLTGAGRPGRQSQDSLVVMAAAAMGWSYQEFLLAILSTRWVG